jgi:hypothetical protein
MDISYFVWILEENKRGAGPIPRAGGMVCRHLDLLRFPCIVYTVLFDIRDCSSSYLICIVETEALYYDTLCPSYM